MRRSKPWQSISPTISPAENSQVDFEFTAAGAKARVEVLTFCSRDLPSIVCQEMVVDLDRTGPLGLKSIVDARHLDGRALRHFRDTPGETDPACDGAALWESAGGLSTCGIAYVTELIGSNQNSARAPPTDESHAITGYRFQAHARQHYRLRQMASVVPSAMHSQPDLEAVRQVALARKRGFDVVRAANRAKWTDLWRGRIRLVGAQQRWQAMADAAFFYLMSSTHVASPASTSIFGLATWHDYHYYYGHVMWDIETFAVPVLSLLQPDAAESILDYRSRNLSAQPAMPACADAEAFSSLGKALRPRDKRPHPCRVLHHGTRITFRWM